jgi:hypothetical protein
MQIVVQDTADGAKSWTLVHGSSVDPGQAMGPLGELRWSGTLQSMIRRPIRAAAAKPWRRHSHLGSIGFSAVRQYATLAEASAFQATHVADLPDGDLVVITYDGGTVLQLADAALDTYAIKLQGLEVICSYTFSFGAVSDATPEPDEE